MRLRRACSLVRYTQRLKGQVKANAPSPASTSAGVNCPS